MTKLPRIKARELVAKLKKSGFAETHQRGSHLYLKNSNKNKIVTVPMHGSQDIPIGTLHNIVVRQAGLSVEEFVEL